MTSLTESADGGTAPGGRVGNVDVLRAVAALMVLAGHAYLLSGRPLGILADRWYDVLVLGGATGVWLFFAISGYVISKPFLDRLVTGQPLPALRGYALRRVVRIFPLYVAALTAFIVIAGAGDIKPWHYPVHFLLLHNLVPGRETALLGVSWTLSIEVLFYCAVPLLALAVRRWRPNVTAEWLAGA
ncbi:MAG TPA: acyltransferase, partial [Thermoleophilaceae bacterium]|nr:acyltransferase [Thermoleophilaceae bacterium]